MSLEADVIIVGAGVAGGLIADRLVATGVRVLVLDSGPRTDRREAIANYRNAVAKTPESAYLPVDWAPRPEVTSLRDGYYVQDGVDTFGSTYERRVGGTTWHWLGTAMRHRPSDFALRSQYGVGEDWPIGYSELEPWYGKAETEMGVAGDSTVEDGSPRSTPYPLPAHPQSYLDTVIRDALRPLNIPIEPTPQARNSQRYNDRPQCCGSSSCIPCCPIGAKYDANVHIERAERAGARVLENSVVFAVDASVDGRISGVRFRRPDGSEESATGRLYLLAAHAIETPKLLLMSGLANSSDQVGRNLMDHPTALSWALSPQPVFPYRGPLSTSGIGLYRDDSLRAQRAAYRIEIGNDAWSWPVGLPGDMVKDLIAQGLRGSALRDAVADSVHRQIRFASLIEQLPLPENRIVPDYGSLDALGIPRPRITFRIDEYAQAGLAAARQTHEAIFQALGANQRNHAQNPYGAGHVMGTCRMGDNPATSVVDRHLRSHDHANLFIAGSSTFPSVGTANPTLTIAALALRLAETMKAAL